MMTYKEREMMKKKVKSVLLKSMLLTLMLLSSPSADSTYAPIEQMQKMGTHNRKQ